MPDLNELRDAFRARPEDEFVNLAGYDPAATPFITSKSDAKKELEERLPQLLFDSHELLFAEEDQAVLLVLQGLDGSGKNGTIKHVVIHLNPAGVRTASFREPTKEEESHDFLWRYRQQLPNPGQLGVFGRSHYEDAIVPRVTEDMTDDDFSKTINEINKFEKKLVESGTLIIKCMLHISFDEQRDRFLRRLGRDDKRWKFSVDDIETRRHWNDFQAAYSTVIGLTTPDHSPWFIIPSDHKWYRNWAIAHLLIETFDSMGLAYPQPDLDLDSLRDQLAPPN